MRHVNGSQLRRIINEELILAKREIIAEQRITLAIKNESIRLLREGRPINEQNELLLEFLDSIMSMFGGAADSIGKLSQIPGVKAGFDTVKQYLSTMLVDTVLNSMGIKPTTLFGEWVKRGVINFLSNVEYTKIFKWITGMASNPEMCNELVDALIDSFLVEATMEPVIDKLSDIYLDSFMTHNSHICHTGDKMAFSLQINEFNVNSNVASSEGGQNIFNRIIIPNEHNNITDVHSCVVHKGKKLNYVCSINPCKLSNISGKITDLNGSSMYGDTASPDGGKLHFVQLTSGATKHVDAHQVFTWSGGTTGNFTTAFAMLEGSTALYFYSKTGTITDHALLGTVSAGGSGIHGLTSNVSTYREGDFPRFIAEFVIVSRD